MAQFEGLFLVLVWRGWNSIGELRIFGQPWCRLSGCCVMNEMSPGLRRRLAPYSWRHVQHRKHADRLSVRVSKVSSVAQCTQYCAVFLFLCLFPSLFLLLLCFFHCFSPVQFLSPFFLILLQFSVVFPAVSVFPTTLILFSAFISFIVSLHHFSFLFLCLFFSFLLSFPFTSFILRVLICLFLFRLLFIPFLPYSVQFILLCHFLPSIPSQPQSGSSLSPLLIFHCPLFFTSAFFFSLIICDRERGIRWNRICRTKRGSPTTKRALRPASSAYQLIWFVLFSFCGEPLTWVQNLYAFNL